MVISKDKARTTAKALCAKKLKYCQDLRKEFDQLVLSCYKDQIPVEVLATFSNHPEWFRTTTHVMVDGYGFNREHVYVVEHVLCNKGDKAYIKMDRELSSLLYKKFIFIEKQLDEHKKLVNETMSSILALKTTKAIKEKFPEAAQLLPESYPVPATIDVSKLRNKLAHQIPNK